MSSAGLGHKLRIQPNILHPQSKMWVTTGGLADFSVYFQRIPKITSKSSALYNVGQNRTSSRSDDFREQNQMTFRHQYQKEISFSPSIRQRSIKIIIFSSFFVHLVGSTSRVKGQRQNEAVSSVTKSESRSLRPCFSSLYTNLFRALSFIFSATRLYDQHTRVRW